MRYRALSVRQPWAGLIAAGIKPTENRSWFSMVQSPGALAICASKIAEPKYVFETAREECAELGIEFPEELCAINGKCIATTEVIGYIHISHNKPSIKMFTQCPLPPMADILNWWAPDQYGWIMIGTRRVEPFPVSGRLGLFQIELPEVDGE